MGNINTFANAIENNKLYSHDLYILNMYHIRRRHFLSSLIYGERLIGYFQNTILMNIYEVS